MVLKIVAAAASVVPTRYYVPTFVVILAVVVIRAFSQGRKTNRERDMHARVVLVTGGFTPMGMTLINELAQRGAHIIALSPHPITSPKVDLLITLLRTTTNNEQIFAEECDLASPESIRSFCTRFLTGQETRLDALVFAHEYQHVGTIFGRQDLAAAEKQRQAGSLATFLMTTLLLPALLVAPVERDIRIVNVVNPFYAAAVPDFTPSGQKTTPASSMFLREGIRALRMVVLTRHLQRVLDALPTGAQVPKTEENAVPVVSQASQASNIVAVSVSPGISRSDTIAPLLGVDDIANRSLLGLILYILLQPLLRLLSKAPAAAHQSILHVLFLPTPFKAVSSTKLDKEAAKTTVIDDDKSPEEILKPGALYSECAVVKLRVPVPLEPEPEPSSAKGKEKGMEEESVKVFNDGELGGEVAGRLVWESFESGLKDWEKENPVNEKAAEAAPEAPSSSPPAGVDSDKT
ncbi:hypothetical protein PLICRDRAFT_48409 [Plicaturopsis crispa FD-325 SS-3]|nr:hypothetical protein PLICRDRAFT_48409 [Plicaturopsis crispa FD-325 SS-3]